ncbi:MAG TPA: hypothetical protein VFR24_05535 [Candidatus Angelobacter sp.]|nr:hypothetical protein [Candidatus Angelobacter sp.]
MFEDLVVELDPPPKRRNHCRGPKERHLTEAAVMLAYGMHLLRTVPDLQQVELHPDGEHGKRFEIAAWLEGRSFVLKERQGKTSYCGIYAGEKQSIVVTSIPGKGDVVATAQGETIMAECKGGIVNTRHPGQVSRLRKGLCEAVGLLMARPKGGRQVAVVPHTETTLQLAQKLASRARDAGIEIALVDHKGNVVDIKPENDTSVS